MKKTLLIVLCCIIAISLIGCDMQSNGALENGTESKEQNNVIENNTSESKNITSNETTNGEETFISSDMGGVGESFTSSYMEYMSFDEAVDYYATDVVIATFEGWDIFDADYCEYVFSVKDRIHGNAPEEITVYVQDDPIYMGHPLVGSYAPQELFLEKNKEYLLVLEHRMSVYYEADIYVLLCNIIIDVETVSNSNMYGQSIIPHSPNFDFSTADLDSTIEYIKELVKDNYSPTALEANPDINTVVSSSENVVVVEVGECVKTWITSFRKCGYHLCTVTETLKGDIPKEKTILVIFNLDEVKPGDHVIVGLNYFLEDNGYEWYQLSTKNSVISTEERDQVIAALETE